MYDDPDEDEIMLTKKNIEEYFIYEFGRTDKYPWIEEIDLTNKLLSKIEEDDAGQKDNYNATSLLRTNKRFVSIVKELLISRLSDPSRPNHINLKELRDILLEYRASSSVMISWGVWNEGRTWCGPN